MIMPLGPEDTAQMTEHDQAWVRAQRNPQSELALSEVNLELENTRNICAGEECTNTWPPDLDGELVGWTIWINEGERLGLLCPACTEFWRAEG